MFCCREAGPRGSDAVRVVPIRGFSVDTWESGAAASGTLGRRSKEAPVRSRSKRSEGRALLRSEELRWWPLPEGYPLLVERSSGGGVGGNTLRVNGGSDC